MRLFLMAFSVIVPSIMFVSCSEQYTNSGKKQKPPSEITTSKGKFKIPSEAFIDGRDTEATPPHTLMKIHVWNKVPRTSPVCKIGHGDKINIMESKYSNQEARYYFKIKSATCKGWISEYFISPEEQQSIGNII